MRMRFATTALAFVGALAGARIAQAQIHREGLPQALKEPLKASAFKDRGDGVVWMGRVDAPPESAWIRVHFKNIKSPPDSKYTIVLRDRSERVAARYTPGQFADSQEFLSDVLFTNRATIEVEGTPRALTFEVDRIIYEVDSVGRLVPQSTVPNWRTVPEAVTLLKKPTLAEAARSVAKLFVGDGFVCTGFLIAPNLLLTNHHCLRESLSFSQSDGAPLERRQCSDIVLLFDFDQQGAPTRAIRTRCVGVKDFDPRLDFAVLQLDPKAVEIEKAPRPFLKLADGPTTFKGGLYVLHHPAGLAKKVSFACESFEGKADAAPILEHDCSTVGGSSGSPLFNEAGEVVALHFAGAYPRNLTMEEIEINIMRGAIYRNKARPVSALQPRLAALVR
ncbi:MAG TPA: serine protease [Vicinamibacterales bacterium]|nr:serine protease [Vicinamibacterales bacterium]